MKDMVTKAKEEIRIICTVRDLSRFYYSDYLDILAKSNVRVRIVLAPTQKIPRFVQLLDQSYVRLMPVNKGDNQCFILKDNDEVMVFLRHMEKTAKNTFAFWTDTSSLINSMRNLFDFSWQYSLPVSYEKYLDHKNSRI